MGTGQHRKLGAADAQRANAHVDVRRSGAEHHRRAGADELREHDPRHELGRLHGEHAGQRDGRRVPAMASAAITIGCLASA